MNGPDVFRLARRLMKVAVRATPGSGFRDLPTSVRIVLVDVHEHPDSTIGQIVERTGFPQSHVSAAVARLRDSGVLVTEADPTDRRRTLVRPARRRPRAAPSLAGEDELLERVLLEELGPGSAACDEVLAALETLRRHLTPDRPTTDDCTPGGTPC